VLTQVTFTADGRRLIAAGREGIHVWDADSGRELRRISVSGAHSYLGLAISRHRRWLGAGTVDSTGHPGGNLVLWSLDGAAPPRMVLTDDQLSVRAVAFSPDEHRIGAAFYRDELSGWHFNGDLATCSVPDCAEVSWLLTEDNEVREGTYDVIPEQAATDLVFTDDGATIVAAVLGLSAHRLDKERYRTFVPVPKLAFYDAHTLRKRQSVNTAGSDLSSIAISLDGSLIATGHDQNSVGLWHALTSRAEAQYQLRPRVDPNLSISHFVTGLAFHPDKRRLAVARHHGVTLLDLVNDTRTDIAEGTEVRYGGLSISPDGSLLIATRRAAPSRFETNTLVSAWSTTTLKQVWSVNVGYVDAPRTAFEPGGKWFVAATTNGLFVHDAATGTRLLTLATGAANDWLAWAPDGRFAGSHGGIARLAAVRQGTRALPLDTLGRQLTLKELIAQVLR
jgi:WD40 repeat protein